MPLPTRATVSVNADASSVAPTPVIGEYAGQSGDDMRARDARSMQAALERSLQEAPGASEAAEAQVETPAPNAARGGATVRRILKIALGLGLVATLGWSPLRAMLTTTSVEALVNARVETIRSPIEGTVESAPQADHDWRADMPPPLLHIVDPLADHSRLDDLRRQYDALESQSRRLARQSEVAVAALTMLTVQVERFRNGRLKLLEARLNAQAAELDTAVAKASQAADTKRRTDQLRKSGVVTAVESDRTQYEWIAATSAQAAASQRLEETKVERDAVADGVFIGDSYNDSPSSDQRAAELRLRVGELEAEAEAVRSQMTLLAGQIAEEDKRYRQRADAVVVLPPSGRVWEMLTGPGEHVNKGQDLMRVLNCAHPIVSANVDEGVYNRLEVGAPAEFRPSQGGGKIYAATIVNLTGAAAASANLAIPPVAMRKSPFYVTVAVEGMSEGGCSVGRTGTVTFATRETRAANEKMATLDWQAADDGPWLVRPTLF